MFTEDLYPSRIGAAEQIIPRKHPVVYSATSSQTHLSQMAHPPLSEAQIRDYEDNGLLVLPDLMPELAEQIWRELDELKERMRGKEELILEPESDEIRTLFNPFSHSSLAQAFFRHPKILGAVQQLLGSQAYLMQSRINLKTAFKGKSFAWHSDFETWHVEDGMPTPRALTAWIMLNDNTEHNGPLYVIPGSHFDYVSCAGTTQAENFRTSLRKQTLGVPSADSMKQILENRSVKSVTGKKGTVVFHECNLMHGSPDNISNKPRGVLMGVYNSVKNKPLEPFGGQAPRPHYLSNPNTEPLEIQHLGLEHAQAA